MYQFMKKKNRFFENSRPKKALKDLAEFDC